ncbi:MAG: response regulator [Hyphomonadaceae bacterium]
MQPLASIQTLVVDDNRQMRFLVRSMLRAAGFLRVAEAESADDALSLMRRISVDLIIADWCMRPVDGIEFTRMVRMNPASPNPYVAIVMISAHSERSRVAAARDAGVNSFLVKPISTRSLFDHVSAALSDARPFVRSEDYFGPDRRRAQIESYCGPFRRASDREGHDEFILDAAEEAR